VYQQKVLQESAKGTTIKINQRGQGAESATKTPERKYVMSATAFERGSRQNSKETIDGPAKTSGLHSEAMINY